jgi:hypothetical protein
MQSRGAVLSAVVLAAFVANGCGDNGGDSARETTSTVETTTSSNGVTTTTRPSTTTTTKKYSFGLPGGDLSPAEFERDVYRGLRTGCETGKAELEARWSRLISPLHVLLFESAVHVCRGDDAKGRNFFDRAGTYGWSGVRSYETVCNTYKAVRSVLEQVDPATIVCPGGSLPPWPDPDPSHPRDDPRTPQDERTTTTSTSSTSSTSSSSSSSSSSTTTTTG